MKPRKPQTTFGYRFYPNPIEREAEACIARCLQATGLKQMPLPIPVETWIEGPMQLRFGVEDLSHLGRDVLGAAYIQEREIVVSERLLSSEGRFRFTCAHELGHCVLHGKLMQAFRDTVAEPQQGRDLHEREADRFAAAFLMPAEAAVHGILQLCRERGIDPMALRESALQLDTWQQMRWRQALTAAFTTWFGVSASAADFRLRELLVPEVGPFMSGLRPPLFQAGN